MKILNRKSVIFICIGLASAILLLIIGKGEDGRADVKEEYNGYDVKIEQKLGELISALVGVSEVKVMVVMESGSEYVYAKNTDISDNSRHEEYHSAGEEEALLLKEIFPEIRGVAVVCKGGENAAVKTEIIELVSRVLDISSNRIFVGN